MFYDPQDLPTEEWLYTLCAEAWGWPPSVTAEQPARTLDWMLYLREEKLKSDKRKQDANEGRAIDSGARPIGSQD